SARRESRSRRSGTRRLSVLHNRTVSHSSSMDLKQHIRNVPDFPNAGILFYDITTLLRDPLGFRSTVDLLSTPYADQGIEAAVDIESRGLILGAAAPGGP